MKYVSITRKNNFSGLNTLEKLFFLVMETYFILTERHALLCKTYFSQQWKDISHFQKCIIFLVKPFFPGVENFPLFPIRKNTCNFVKKIFSQQWRHLFYWNNCFPRKGIIFPTSGNKYFSL